MVRLKDGIVRNCVVQQISAEKFKRNNDTFVSRGHLITPSGEVMHCCEMEQFKQFNENSPMFVRMLPPPFNLFVLFGDVLFVLLNKERTMVNLGQNDFRLFLNNQHPRLSPGEVLEDNQRRIEMEEEEEDEEEDGDDDEDDDEEGDLTATQEATTQEATTGTFVTHETASEDEYTDDDNVIDD